MKLTCNRNSLLNAINIVSKAVSSRTTLPILECILLDAGEDFKLTANDLELGIETAPIEAEIDETGKVALEAKLFSEIIRKVNGENVKIEVNAKNEAVITSGTSEFKIIGQNGEEFPSVPTVSKSVYYSVKQSELKDMISQTMLSVSLDESQPVLTGELIEIKGSSMNIVAVDGYRISFRKSEITSSKDASVIVPSKTLREITKILSSEEEEMALIYVTDKHILFDLGGNMIVSRLIEGEYIKYSQTFTDEFKTRIVINKSDMVAALERASLISRDARKIPVKLDITKEKIVITSQADMGTAYEEVYAEVTGDALKIAFNPKYLIDALRAVDDEKVAVQFNSSLSPCIIKPEEGDSYKYLILPLRMWWWKHMRTIEISTEFIKLQQLLKLADIVGYGSDAKMLILNGQVKVNGEIAHERGKKIREGDIVEVEGEEDLTVKVNGEI